MRPKKIPMRMCTGCREMKPKKELLRIVRTPEQTIVIDRIGKQNGRGAYVCNDKECLNKAIKQKSLDRALECTISAEIYDQLAESIKDNKTSKT